VQWDDRADPDGGQSIAEIFTSQELDDALDLPDIIRKTMPLTNGENENTGLLFARFDDAPVIFQWE
jgi:hypothetical protein